MELLRLLEYGLLAVSALGLAVSLVMLGLGFGDAAVADTLGTNGPRQTVAKFGVRGPAYLFLAQLAFFYLAVSFVTTPIPSPLPPGTGERVSMVTLGAVILVIFMLDSYLTKRELLRRL